MVSATQLKGGELDGGALVADGLGFAKENIGRGHVVERFVITRGVVVFNKLGNGLLKLPGEVVVVQTDDVLQRTMVALNFALGHGMVRLAVDVLNVLVSQEGG